MTKPEIAVIIPCFNAERYIRVAVDSVLSQRDVAFELVVIDDGSYDNSLEVLREYGDAFRVISGPNRGASFARNTGVDATSAPLIKYLDADDYLLPGALEAQVNHFSSLSAKRFSYGRMLRLLESTGQLLPHSPRDARRSNVDIIEQLVLDPPVTSALVYSRSLITEIGGFNPLITLRDDFDLFFRAMLAGYRPVACSAPIFVYRDHNSGDRISRRSDASDYHALTRMFHSHVSEIRAIVPFPVELGRALARAIWTSGRNVLREGHDLQAKEMFDLAFELAKFDSVRGNQLYRLLTRLVGPIRAERLGTSFRRGRK